MSVDTPTPAQSILEELLQRLVRVAKRLDLAVADSSTLTKNVFLGGGGSEVARLSPSELPNPVRAISIGRYTILLGMLPEQPSLEAVTESLRRIRNQCVIARSYLSPREVLDLHCILVGPRGSESVDDWGPLALLVERDDKVARKFAWLRPSKQAADDASFEDLIKRTFLARPWVNESTFTMASLDNLNRAAAMWDESVPRGTVDEWMNLILNPPEDADTLVNGLVETWERRGQA